MIIISISESSAILVSSLYWLTFESINPSEIGAIAGPLSRSQMFTNFFIMVIGEWIVTDR